MRASILAFLALEGCPPGLHDSAPPDEAPFGPALLDMDSDGFPARNDCDDTDPAVHPGATELCDGVDNDCDGTVDEDAAADAPTWYADSDGDGYGDPAATRAACAAPDGYVADNTDCDDTDPAVHPDAGEIMGDGIDQDCARITGEWPGEPAATFILPEDWDGPLTGAGDVDGDGLPDIAIGHPQATSDSGLVYVVPGTVRGVWALPEGAWTLQGGHHAGTSVVGVGDMTGDGQDDLLIGDPWDDEGDGVAWLVPGPITADGMMWDAWIDIRGGTRGGLAGYDVASAGDTDGDGVSEVLVGAPRWFDDAPGRAFLLDGPLVNGRSTTEADATFIGRYDADEAGWSVASAGDVDADGYGDVLVGAIQDQEGGPWAGAAFLLLGPLSGDRPLATADAVVDGEGAKSSHGPYRGWAGWDVLGPGDTDGDGFDDVVVGAAGCPSEEGWVALFRGPLTGTQPFSAADAAFGQYWLGEELAGPGDVDGDGLADLLLPEFSAYLLYAPFADEIDTSRTPRSAEFPWDVRGASAAAPGDVDGGGRPDLLVSQGNTAALYRTEQ